MPPCLPDRSLSFAGVSMYCSNEPLILASASPRRQDFLRWMGLEYQIEAAAIDESRREGEAPVSFVQRLAIEKGAAVAANFPAHWVISGDTVVCLDSQVLGKPQGKTEAVEMLMRLAGRTHSVLSAYSVIHRQRGIAEYDVVRTEVTFLWHSAVRSGACCRNKRLLLQCGRAAFGGAALVAGAAGSDFLSADPVSFLSDIFFPPPKNLHVSP